LAELYLVAVLSEPILLRVRLVFVLNFYESMTLAFIINSSGDLVRVVFHRIPNRMPVLIFGMSLIAILPEIDPQAMELVILKFSLVKFS
jgi:hypothetical protein